MIQILGNKLYYITPDRYLKWKTNSNLKEKHILYCEKLAIISILFILYAIIIFVFTYLNWKKCTNIIDLIHGINDKTYKEDLFRRSNSFCNTMDGFFVVYVSFLIIILFLNILFGIIYRYYRKYKCSKTDKNKDNYSEKVIVHIPLYNEDFNTIKSTIDSVCNLNYNMDNILLLIIVDGIITNSNSDKSTDYVLLGEVLRNNNYVDEYNNKINDNSIKYKDNRLKIYNGVYQAINYSVILKIGNLEETNRRGNRGKKDSALIIYETIFYMTENVGEASITSYDLIIEKLQESVDNKFQSILDYNHMMIIDCDTDIETNGLISLCDYLMSNDDCVAVCGQTVVKNTSENFITVVQSFEYFISHLLLKTFEHIVYKVLVLSGCFTLFKLRINGKPTINMNIINNYTKDAKSLYEKNLLELGEDRYLTVLIIQEYPDKHLSYISDAECLTNVPNSLSVLIDQRRRWCNSLIVCLFLLFLKAPKQSLFKHLKMYMVLLTEMFIVFILPVVIIIGLVNSIISIAIQGFSLMPVLITVIIILLNLIIVILAGRLDMALRFIPFFICLSVFSIYMPIFSIMNLDNLKWGLTRDIEINDAEESFIEITTPSNEIITLEENFYV